MNATKLDGETYAGFAKRLEREINAMSRASVVRLLHAHSRDGFWSSGKPRTAFDAMLHAIAMQRGRE